MIRTIAFYTFVTLSFINVLHYGAYLVGANIYDIRALKTKYQASKRRRHREVPLVSVLIPAHNEALTVLRCLESIHKNSYRKLQIIVINDASTDETGTIAQDFAKTHQNSRRDIRVVNKRRNVGKAAALNSVLRRGYVQGDLVMTLDADSFIAPDAIEKAVKYFHDPNVAGVAANVRIMHQSSILGILQRFEHMIGYRSKKFYDVSNSEFVVGGVASTFRREAMSQVGYYNTNTATEDISLSLKIVSQGNKGSRIVYGVDIRAMTEGVQTYRALLKQRYRWKLGTLQNLIQFRSLVFNRDRKYSRMLTFYRMPMAFLSELMLLVEPIIVLYLLVLSLRQGYVGFVAGAYLLISLITAITLWQDEHLPLKQKVRLSAYVPFMYFAYYIMNTVQILAVIQCVLKPKRLLGEAKEGNMWKSPERLGKHLLTSS